MAQIQEFDVVIIGGGPAGAATAITLCRYGRKVLLIDSSMPTALKVGETLPPVAKPLLSQLGAWDTFVSGSHLPCFGNQSAWGSTQILEMDFLMNPYGHGWHLDRIAFDQELLDLAIRAGTTVFRTTRVVGAKSVSYERWTLKLPHNQIQPVTSFVVDASGRSRWFSRWQGIKTEAYDQLVALVAIFTASPTTNDEDTRTLIESAPDGWWYTALLPGHRRVVAYLTDPNISSFRHAKRPEGYLSLLSQTNHIQQRVSQQGYILTMAPFATSASSYRLTQVIGNAWLAVGDAAGAYDPLSSQGILIALEAGIRAGYDIDHYLAGDHSAIAAYSAYMARTYATFLRERRGYYAAERRWATRPFWQQRTRSASTSAG